MSLHPGNPHRGARTWSRRALSLPVEHARRYHPPGRPWPVESRSVDRIEDECPRGREGWDARILLGTTFAREQLSESDPRVLDVGVGLGEHGQSSLYPRRIEAARRSVVALSMIRLALRRTHPLKHLASPYDRVWAVCTHMVRSWQSYIKHDAYKTFSRIAPNVKLSKVWRVTAAETLWSMPRARGRCGRLSHRESSPCRCARICRRRDRPYLLPSNGRCLSVGGERTGGMSSSRRSPGHA
jgi:hypothetical protein